jgi:hypothetical protein
MIGPNLKDSLQILGIGVQEIFTTSPEEEKNQLQFSAGSV